MSAGEFDPVQAAVDAARSWANETVAPASRFSVFTPEERESLMDALSHDAEELDPDEDPTFPPIVERAQRLLDELRRA